MLERKCREIVESKLEDGQFGFCPGCSTTDQIFTLKQIFEKSWKYGKNLFACFVDLEKAYDRVPRDKLWKIFWDYDVDGQLLRAIKSFYCRPEVCVRVNGKQSKPFHVGVGIRQGCILSLLLSIVYMSWIDQWFTTFNGLWPPSRVSQHRWPPARLENWLLVDSQEFPLRVLYWRLETTSNNLDQDFELSLIRVSQIFCQN